MGLECQSRLSLFRLFMILEWILLGVVAITQVLAAWLQGSSVQLIGFFWEDFFAQHPIYCGGSSELCVAARGEPDRGDWPCFFK